MAKDFLGRKLTECRIGGKAETCDYASAPMGSETTNRCELAGQSIQGMNGCPKKSRPVKYRAGKPEEGDLLKGAMWTGTKGA